MRTINTENKLMVVRGAGGGRLDKMGECSILLNKTSWSAAWVAQSVERPTSTQVTISRFVGLSPMSGSVLTARILEPALDSVSPLLSALRRLMLRLSLFLNN